MKNSSILLFLLLSSLADAQTDNKIILGNIDSIHSRILNEDRKIWVYVPNSGAGDIYSKQRYPVVYLLDGDAHFYSVVGMIQQLSSVNGNTVCPEMIVVGIPNTDRTRDLTPTHVKSDPPFMDSNSTKTSGGGEQFISFIEKEVMPHIDSAYPTEPYRVLIGHSFGGLTAINTLTHHTKLFNSYVVIDPSMWWDHKKLLGETKEALATRQFAGVSLFMGIANTMNPGTDTAKVQRDSSAFTRHIRSILELNKYFLANRQNQLNYDYKYYNTDDHGSVPLITEYDALHFIFNFYPLKLSLSDHINPNMAVMSKIEKHYEDVSKQFGYKVKVPEGLVNNIAYQQLAKKKYDDAEYMFKLNVSNYPESSNAFDSLGDLYDAKGDKEKAIENYKKALSIKENSDTRKKLEKLQGK
jgi:predicted alpha/beta superfamily hydrolase